ncbi:MAG: hypothetical protein ACJ8GK_02275 [Luteimonas sp.]
MNRKLQHTFKALSASAAVFTVLLLAGSPAAPMMPVATTQLSGESAALLETPIESGIDASEAPATSASQRRHLRHSRAVLALPYFSFAQGLRRSRS